MVFGSDGKSIFEKAALFFPFVFLMDIDNQQSANAPSCALISKMPPLKPSYSLHCCALNHAKVSSVGIQVKSWWEKNIHLKKVRNIETVKKKKKKKKTHTTHATQ